MLRGVEICAKLQQSRSESCMKQIQMMRQSRKARNSDMRLGPEPCALSVTTIGPSSNVQCASSRARSAGWRCSITPRTFAAADYPGSRYTTAPRLQCRPHAFPEVMIWSMTIPLPPSALPRHSCLRRRLFACPTRVRLKLAEGIGPRSGVLAVLVECRSKSRFCRARGRS